MKYRLTLLMLWMCVPLVKAQQSLDAYIGEALKNNIVLQQKNVSLEKAQYALKSAKSLFLPTVAFSGTWSTADGGRNIPLPLGDLLNPVYSTLNQLTATNNFPLLENQSINFLPKNYYDAKVRTTIPILNSDLINNRKISEQQVILQGFEVAIYKRELVKDVKTAYYNFLNAQQAVEVYQSGLELAKEGLRVNEKLLEAGKGLPAYVLRSKSEVENAEAQVTAARQQLVNANMYFNFLLNREQAEVIETVFDEKQALTQTESLLTQLDLNSGREELKALDQVISINQSVEKMNRQFAVPKLGAFVDLGSQSEGLNFNGNTRYYMFGFQLDIPIFSGNRNTIKIKQANLDLQNARLNADLTTKQLNLAVKTAQNNLRAAYQNYQSSLKQLEAASSYQRLIEKGYRAGSNSFIETVDARNQFTSAKLLANINRFKVLSAFADVERETATYPIP